MLRTKIICTLGPSSSSRAQIDALIAAGMNVARINFSHGTHEQHAALAATVREAAQTAGRHVAIMGDLQGPKIRVGSLERGAVTLSPGTSTVITTEDVVGTAQRLSTSYESFASDVKPGDTVLMVDGLMRLRVERIAGNDVTCTVIDGGVLREHQGMNLPSTKLSAPSLSERDIDDLTHALSLQFDYIALSFVRSAADVEHLRMRIRATGSFAEIVAKIERAEAINDIEAIVNVTDAVMVARGDLGVELPPQDVPRMQKKIIRVCNAAAVPVITATQMLESMILNPRPTRAEASDVANAVLDGTDAVMLSGETAAGAHPLEAADIMAEICRSAELIFKYGGVHEGHAARHGRAMEHAVAQSACQLAKELGAVAVLCLTRSGTTARLLSHCRPAMPVIAMTDVESTARRACMYWGVQSIVIPNPQSTEEALEVMKAAARDHGLGVHGETVIITGGHPLTQLARTNFVKVERL